MTYPPLTRNAFSEQSLVINDEKNHRSITISGALSAQTIVLNFTEGDAEKNVSLTSEEVDALNTWRNSGRRSSYWEWDGWDAVRARA